MGDIVNLNKARKIKAKDQARATAKANRALHGVTKPEKDRARAERENAAAQLDQTRREPPTS